MTKEQLENQWQVAHHKLMLITLLSKPLLTLTEKEDIKRLMELIEPHLLYIDNEI